jgi:hypothetical protein
MLLVTAVAKLFASGGHSRVFQVHDELLQIGYRPLLIAVGLVEIGAAYFLFKSRSELRRSLILLWLSTNFLCYHLGNYLLGFHRCPCLGGLAEEKVSVNDNVNFFREMNP